MENGVVAEEEIKLEVLKKRLNAFGKERGLLIPLLQMMQEALSYLPEKAIQVVAEHLDITLQEVYGVATFYNQFRFNPPGKYPFKVCLGTACHVKGGEIILENFERKLEIGEGETTKDREFSIERVACVGCCALAPVVLIGETVQGNMAPSKVEGIFTRIEVEKEIAERENQPDES